jgi:hypothetical protein
VLSLLLELVLLVLYERHLRLEAVECVSKEVARGAMRPLTA